MVFILDGQRDLRTVILAVSDAGVFHGTGNAGIFCGLELILDGSQAFLDADTGIQNLARRRV